MKIYIFLIIAFVCSTQSLSKREEEEDCAYLTCRYQCDDPIIKYRPPEVCDDLNCTIVWRNDTPASIDKSKYKAKCGKDCPKDSCVKESCPMCSYVCKSLPKSCKPYCIEQKCDRMNCNWAPETPKDVIKPTCVLQCESPACMAPPKNATIIPTAIDNVMRQSNTTTHSSATKTNKDINMITIVLFLLWALLH